MQEHDKQVPAAACCGSIFDQGAPSAQGPILSRVQPAQGLGLTSAGRNALQGALDQLEASMGTDPADILPRGEAFTRETCIAYMRHAVALALNRDRTRPRCNGWVTREEAEAEFVRILREILAGENVPHDAGEQILGLAALRLSDWTRWTNDSTGHTE